MGIGVRVQKVNRRGECFFFFFFKQKTAYEIGTGDWSSDVCSSDLSMHASSASSSDMPAAIMASMAPVASQPSSRTLSDRKSVV